jgi:hypothetical protein
LEGLTTDEKRRLLQLAGCAVNFGWSYTIQKNPQVKVAFEAIALCQQLSTRGTLKLINALSAAILTGDTLTGPFSAKEPTD